VFTSISSSPAKKPVAGSYELGGSFSSTTSSLEFLGPGRDEVELGLLVDVEVVLEDETVLGEEDVTLEEVVVLEDEVVEGRLIRA
jgi:hypothetical protein